MKDIFEQEIMPVLEQTRAEWLKAARTAAVSLGQEQHEVTINDVRAICPPPDNVDPRVMGAVIGATLIG